MGHGTCSALAAIELCGDVAVKIGVPAASLRALCLYSERTCHPMGRGIQTIEHGICSIEHGLWSIEHGFRTIEHSMDIALWSIDKFYGPWAMFYGR